MTIEEARRGQKKRSLRPERPRRGEVGFSGRGQLAPSPSARESGERCKPPVGSGAKPRTKNDFFVSLKCYRKKSSTTIFAITGKLGLDIDT